MAQGTNIEVRAEMHVVDSKNVLAMGDVYLDQNIVLHNVRLVQTEKDGKVLNFVSFPRHLQGCRPESKGDRRGEGGFPEGDQKGLQAAGYRRGGANLRDG